MNSVYVLTAEYTNKIYKSVAKQKKVDARKHKPCNFSFVMKQPVIWAHGTVHLDVVVFVGVVEEHYREQAVVDNVWDCY